jgi:hypothetical protein
MCRPMHATPPLALALALALLLALQPQSSAAGRLGGKSSAPPGCSAPTDSQRMHRWRLLQRQRRRQRQTCAMMTPAPVRTASTRTFLMCFVPLLSAPILEMGLLSPPLSPLLKWLGSVRPSHGTQTRKKTSPVLLVRVSLAARGHVAST